MQGPVNAIPPVKTENENGHAIFYDFERSLERAHRKEATAALTYENVHLLISGSLGDTLEHESTHICVTNPKELIGRFMEGPESGVQAKKIFACVLRGSEATMGDKSVKTLGSKIELTLEANKIEQMLKYRKAPFPKSVSTTFVAHCRQ